MEHPIEVPDARQFIFQGGQPEHTVLGKLLYLRLELGLDQIQIIDGADTQEVQARILGADTVHQCAARAAEVVGHDAL